MAKILYIHGFASCGEGNKSLTLQSYFGQEDVLTIDLPPSPKDAIEKLEALIDSFKVELLIGSSLGGFYATYLAEKYQLKSVLVNPSTQPWETLSPYVGWQKRYCDEEVFEFKARYLEDLKTLQTIPKRGKYLVLLQSEDEVLDYAKAQSFYNEHKIIVEYGGNHRFENIDDYLSMIANFR
ncbi:MAG: YqiA/YcfP family alpha/beta fold hydrolase [Campylobacterota bacterium]|nr:YqiA/YcfP family alpha/beta fold hydrolase [Campylobacterota bacterium]